MRPPLLPSQDEDLRAQNSQSSATLEALEAASAQDRLCFRAIADHFKFYLRFVGFS